MQFGLNAASREQMILFLHKFKSVCECIVDKSYLSVDK